jgi:D-cysteine desulfhydrase
MAQNRGRNRHRNQNRFRRPRRDLAQPRQRIDEVLAGASQSASNLQRQETLNVNTMAEVNAEYAPALFSLFPELGERLAWVSLRGAAEPVVPKRLVRSQHLFGTNYVFMKQEELDFYIIPENSARKLEFIMGDALRRGRSKFVSSGILGSHHCLAVVKAASELGHKSEVVLKKCPLTSEALQMVGAMENLGASVKLRKSERGFRWTRRVQDFWANIFRNEIIPPWGFSTKGALGYVNAMCELRIQIDEGQIPMPNQLVISVESGSTLVGLEVGKRLVGLDDLQIIAFQAAESETLEPQSLADLASATATLLNRFLNKPIKSEFTPKDFKVERDYLFSGYGIIPDFLTRWENEFIELEAIELGENSSLKGLYGMSDWIKRQNIQDKKILFWNTFCPFRLGDLADNFTYSRLPWRLKRWMRAELREGRLPEVGLI